MATALDLKLMRLRVQSQATHVPERCSGSFSLVLISNLKKINTKQSKNFSSLFTTVTLQVLKRQPR